ncbi:hydroxypyruvate isomerase family protein [Albidovulum sp.]|uniref:hydroxypyruvate isomerase family protein n=1 Tax=Albidovulum sp. TaxID=1872424 RepID=UPI001D85B588|nr:TIM barrel protein [Paracoccaceae bacterium]
MRFSANTGFLWPGLPFLDRIRRAAAAGFDAVEFHDEAQRTDPADLRAALAETGLPVIGLNVRMGTTAGCAAIPGQQAQARRDIDEAIAMADLCDAAAIHVLSGNTDAPEAAGVLAENLRHALAATGRVVLIEPICRAANPAYFLHDLDQALAILAEVAHPRLKILFDCYHIETQHGDCLARFRAAAGQVGHVQIASIPTREEPDRGTLDYATLLPAMRAAGYAGAFGCEYRPHAQTGAGTEAGLGWMRAFRQERRPRP